MELEVDDDVLGELADTLAIPPMVASLLGSLSETRQPSPAKVAVSRAKRRRGGRK
jgi:hypothetical protein